MVYKHCYRWFSTTLAYHYLINKLRDCTIEKSKYALLFAVNNVKSAEFNVKLTSYFLESQINQSFSRIYSTRLLNSWSVSSFRLYKLSIISLPFLAILLFTLL